MQVYVAGTADSVRIKELGALYREVLLCQYIESKNM